MGGEVGPAVGDQELELVRQQGAERGDDLLGGDLGADGKQRQPQAPAGAVIGQDQDRDPGRLGGGRRQGCLQLLLLRQPLGILLLAPGEGGLALGPQQRASWSSAATIGGPVPRRPVRGTEPGAPLAAGGLPGGVLLLALLEDLRPLRGPAAPLLPQRAARPLLRRLPVAAPPGGARRRAPGARRGSPHELPHGRAIGASPGPRTPGPARSAAASPARGRSPLITSRPDDPLTAGRRCAASCVAGTKHRSTLRVWPGSSAVRFWPLGPPFWPAAPARATARRRAGCA